MLPEPATGHRPDIDGLRTVAVLAVLLYHAGFSTFGGGFVGVDVFFVISGFLITRLIRAEVAAGTFTFSGFYIRRARRLFPALAATLILTFVAAAVVQDPVQFAITARTMVTAVLSVSNFQFWQEIGYFRPSFDPNVLLHTWSLAVEEQFYLLWPLILVAMLRWRPRWLPWLLLATILLSVTASQMRLKIVETATFYLLPYRAFELAIGALMVWAVPRRPQAGWLLDLLALAGLAMIGWAIATFSGKTPFPGVHALLPCLGSALLIFAGEAPRTGWLLRNRLAVGIGLISYSLYLVHWPLLMLARQWKFHPTTVAERSSLLFIALALAILSYVFVETPFRRTRVAAPAAQGAPPPRRHRRFLLGCATTAGVLVVAAIAVNQTRGWPQRFHPNPDVQRLLLGRQWDSALHGGRMRDARLRVAVIGDSHIAVLVGLRDWGRLNGVDFVRNVSNGGCPPLLGVSVNGNERQSRRCNVRRDIELRKIAHGDYDAVVLVARWGLYTGEVTPGDSIRPRWLTTTDVVDAGDGTLARSRAVFVEGLRRTVQLMHDSGKPVMFVGQVPPLGANPYPCVIRQDGWADVEKRCVAATWAQMHAEAMWATDVAASSGLGRSGPGFKVFDPFAMFCRGERCRVTEGGEMLYRDDNHLSVAGSRKVARQLGPEVVALAEAARLGSGARPDR